MHKKLPEACNLLNGCLSKHVHIFLAWSFVGLFALAIVAALLWTNISEEPGSDAPPKEGTVYKRSQPVAENVKAITQMAIGVITVSVVGWKLLYEPGSDPAKLVLDGVGVGLAVAAAFELAYTLFTPGPDEALDPLMLGVSATMLLKLAQIEHDISLANAGAFLLLGALLAILFATRLMLAERAEGERPHIWWIPHQRDKNTDDDQPM